MTSKKVLQNKGFTKTVVTKCLTDKCEECTGSYINRILNHTLICKCPCSHASRNRGKITDHIIKNIEKFQEKMIPADKSFPASKQQVSPEIQ